MFYSQFILAKKGPLGTIWIAAHLERKLRKNQVADTDIGVSVDSILFPEAPIALRMSSHLLLGVVRIYNRKVNYLFDDCSEALLNVKQAFRSAAVDLPPEESKAPYHSITLPEKFDLDDFELPDSDIFKGNYVDHHISSREQITLQDNMEGVSYSTSKFGLDETFGDGDASGLDLDEELFLDKIETADAADESADPETSYRAMTPLKPDEHTEDMFTNLENMFGGADEHEEAMDYAQAPNTPGLAEEPNLSDAKNASTCEEHMESEYHITESNVKENDNNINVPCEDKHDLNNNNVPCEDKHDLNWCSRDDTISNVVPVPQGQHEENGHLSSVLEIMELEPHKKFPTKGQDEDTMPTSELTDRIEESLSVLGLSSHFPDQDEGTMPTSADRIEVSDVPPQKDLSTEAVNDEKAHFLSVDETSNHYQGPNDVPLQKDLSTEAVNKEKAHFLSVDEASNHYQGPNDVPLQKDLSTEAVNKEKAHFLSVDEASDHYQGPNDAPLQKDLSTEAVNEKRAHFLSVDETSNHYQGLNEVVLKKCTVVTSGLADTVQQVSECVSVNDQQKSRDVDGTEVALGNQDVSFVEIPRSQAFQEVTKSLNLEAHDKGVACVTLVSGLCMGNPDVTKPVGRIETGADAKSDTSMLETNEGERTIAPGEDIQVAIDEPNAQVHNTSSQDTLVKNLNNITEPELPAPEKLLSLPEFLIGSHRDMLVEASPSGFKGLDVIHDAGSKSAVGRKRSFTESTLTEQSLNSVESSRQVRVKMTGGSLPGDDDMLSSILAGRLPSVLNVKPTPPTEVTSMKRARNATRTGAPKRKVIVDDTMVLHGDMIRHQLTSTGDIRRVRKKAPCTFAEISMLEKQHKGDEIFLGTMFTGMAVELASLHGQTYDLSLITVCKDDVNVPSIGTATEARQLSQDDKNDAFEILFGPNMAYMDDKYAASLETMAVSQLRSPHNEGHVEDLSGNNVTKIHEQVRTDVENPLPSENIPEEVNYTSLDADFSREEQNKPTHDMGYSYSQQEPLVNMNAAEVGINLNTVSENLYVIPEAENLLPSENRPEGVNYTSLDAGFSREEQNKPTHDMGYSYSQQEPLVNMNAAEVGINLNTVSENLYVIPEVENLLPSENRPEELNYTSLDGDFSREEQNKPTHDVGYCYSQQEPSVNMNATEVGINLNTVSENLYAIPEVNPFDLVQTGPLNGFNERNSHMDMNASADVLDQMVHIQSVELNNSVGVNGGQENDNPEGAENETAAVGNILPDMFQDAAVEVVPDGTNHGELEHNFENEIYNITSNMFGEHMGVGFSNEGLVTGMENDLVNNGENLNQSEVYQPNMTDGGISGFDLHDRDDINYSDAGIDTEFLNVDDDELNEGPDDHMSDDEETQFTDNSGWSLRTRAVSKYLQTAFIKEAERGKKILSMDNLLTGKTRKEASRMFFETLVLKTRDYIGVEQPNPYDDVTIKPRTSLMKSNF